MNGSGGRGGRWGGGIAVKDASSGVVGGGEGSHLGIFPKHVKTWGG